MEVDNYKFFHLIPHFGYGGVENAAKNFNNYCNENFEFKVIFINKFYLKDSGNFTKNIIKIFQNNLKIFCSIHNRKKTILISSLWKSCLLAAIAKLFKKDIIRENLRLWKLITIQVKEVV